MRRKPETAQQQQTIDPRFNRVATGDRQLSCWTCSVKQAHFSASQIQEMLMSGFLMTLTSMIGVMLTLPYWRYSKKWGNRPCFLMSLATIIIATFWLNGRF